MKDIEGMIDISGQPIRLDQKVGLESLKSLFADIERILRDRNPSKMEIYIELNKEDIFHLFDYYATIYIPREEF